MRDHALDTVIVGIGGGLGLGEHEFGVEDVQPLVLHRPHIEVGDRGDHELIEIIFQAETLLVPAHAVP